VPELPEVETVCRTLAPIVTGRSIRSFELLWPRTIWPHDRAGFVSRIAGKQVTRVSRRAKLIVLDLDDGSAITVHLRMTGELLWLASGSNPDEHRLLHLRAEFRLDDGSGLLFLDTRKFGRINHLEPDAVESMNTSFGIEPLADEFTADWLHGHLGNRHRQLKPLLLDQRFIAGLGNIYVDEALFVAGLHPLTRSHLITRDQAESLRNAVVSVLGSALDRRGTTLRDYRSGLGQPGDNVSYLQVYGKKPGSPCPRCGTGLSRLVVGQRGSIFCPVCQPAVS
jgi:formamidopyrimidine-DNA glycosylase